MVSTYPEISRFLSGEPHCSTSRSSIAGLRPSHSLQGRSERSHSAGFGQAGHRSANRSQSLVRLSPGTDAVSSGPGTLRRATRGWSLPDAASATLGTQALPPPPRALLVPTPAAPPTFFPNFFVLHRDGGVYFRTGWERSHKESYPSPRYETNCVLVRFIGLGA